MTETFKRIKKRTISSVERGEYMVPLLVFPNDEMCSLITDKYIGKDLKKTDFIHVFELNMPGNGKRKYVAKSSLNIIGGVMEYYGRSDMDKDLFETYQALIGYKDKDILLLPKSAVKDVCKTKKDLFFKSIPYIHSPIKVPKGSYLCNDQIYSEFFISVLVGESFRKGECINFFDTHAMFSCYISSKDGGKSKDFRQYIIMDKVDGSFLDNASCCSAQNYIGKIPGKYVNNIRRGIFIQLMFAISFYQDRFRISHNDLHMGNVFVEYVTDETMFNNKKVIDNEWYHYHLQAKDKKEACDIYFPSIPVIVKIGDFGLAVKYSEPIVGDIGVFEDGYDQYDKTGPWIPNMFLPSYDSTFATESYIISGCSGDKFLDQAQSFLTNDKLDTVIREENYRPVLKELHNLPSAEDLLRSDVFSKYRIKPKDGKIITLGVL